MERKEEPAQSEAARLQGLEESIGRLEQLVTSVAASVGAEQNLTRRSSKSRSFRKSARKSRRMSRAKQALVKHKKQTEHKEQEELEYLLKRHRETNLLNVLDIEHKFRKMKSTRSGGVHTDAAQKQEKVAAIAAEARAEGGSK